MTLIQALGPHAVPMLVFAGVMVLSLTVAVVALLADY